jgi:hypothetical protein
LESLEILMREPCRPRTAAVLKASRNVVIRQQRNALPSDLFFNRYPDASTHMILKRPGLLSYKQSGTGIIGRRMKKQAFIFSFL